MTDATVIRIGQDNGAGDTDALFLKKFSGEVLTAFEEANKMGDKHFIRQINSGKSAQFPATWKVSSSYHTPGAELTGQSANVSERVIKIDDLLVSDVFIAQIEEAKNHYDYRSIYSTEAGRELARTRDKNVLQVGVLAARASATVSGANGGSKLTNASYDTSGSALAGGLFDAAEALDEKDIPEENRFASFRPAQYYLLVQDTNTINRDWGGAGAYATGEVFRVADIAIQKMNHLPSTNIASGPAAYQGDFSNTFGLVWHPSAMGTVQLMDLAVEMGYDIRRQGTLIVAKYAVGHGILRPESAVELATA